jgi:thioredoxin 1
MRAAWAAAWLPALLLGAVGAAAQTAAPAARAHHEENAALYAQWGLDPAHLPYPKAYPPGADARATVKAARRTAREHGRFLMVSFGANWCPDCRALHRSLEDPETRRYLRGTFDVVNVDVGDFDRNTAVAQELGVDLQMGIPVAVFYAPDGAVIGNTNRGELEPARTYTSREILAFLRNVATERRVTPLRAVAGAGTTAGK